jgi:hypothetical protein
MSKRLDKEHDMFGIDGEYMGFDYTDAGSEWGKPSPTQVGNLTLAIFAEEDGQIGRFKAAGFNIEYIENPRADACSLFISGKSPSFRTYLCGMVEGVLDADQAYFKEWLQELVTPPSQEEVD